jgi:septum formation protein
VNNPRAVNDPVRLVLASTSRYRKDLLERLRIPFSTASPGIDETRETGEDPVALVHRLAREKAEAVAARFPGAVIIGADQTAVRGQTLLGKPGSEERCIAQLRDSSGQRLAFHTAVHVLDTRNQRHDAHVDTTTVTFRRLEETEVARYVATERPLDCAGGFKCEGLGIALFERIDSVDPTALTGLPLIWLASALRRAGLAVP